MEHVGIQRLRRVEQMLLRLPHVTGVGFGWKETASEITGRCAWRVYVRRKLLRPALQVNDLVPAEIEGIVTDVVPALTAIPASVDVNTLPVPLCPGVTISNLRGLLNDKAVDRNATGLGTLGFFALVNGCRRREVVLVSNRHVLLAHGAGRSDPIYRPMFSQSGETCVISRDMLEPIAEIVNEGAEANHHFQYPSEPAGDYFVDCASARLLDEEDVRTTLRFVSDGNVEETAVRSVARMHPLDVVGGRAPRVRKFGGATGLTTGRVVDVAAPVEAAGGPLRLRNLVIRGASGKFVEPGDSGALVLNERDQAIGLVWGRSDTDANVAYACHIHPVLDRLKVTMMAGGLA